MASRELTHKSPSPDEPPTPHELAHWAPWAWGFLGLLALALALSRYLDPLVPVDFSAYLAAAQTFDLGQNPYTTQLYSAPSFRGFVYIYPPGTLPLLAPLTWIAPSFLTALETLLHLGLFAVALGYLWRYFGLKSRLPLPLGLALLFMWHPFTLSFRSGNLASYMFMGFVACVWLSEQPRHRARHLLLALLLGVALVFKPMWGLSAGAVLLLRRRWGAAAGLLAGALIIGALSLMPWHGEVLLTDWWARLAELRVRFKAVSLLEIYAPLVPVVALIWAAGALALMRRHADRLPEIWLWACPLVLIWPRLSAYSYLILLPIIFFAWRQRGWKRALVYALPTLEPIFWVYSALDLVGPSRYLVYAWVWAIAVVLFVDLWRLEPPSARPASSNAPNSDVDL